MIILVDAMGGDFAPEEIVKGAVWAAQDYNVAIELVGKVDKIQEVLDEIAKNLENGIKMVQVEIGKIKTKECRFKFS